MTSSTNACPECGKPTSGRAKLFCKPACRQVFNNRRLQRGAEMYDLFRALRRERSEATKLKLWGKICLLELVWQEEDQAQRPGRRSYMPPEKALAILQDRGSLPRGEVLVRRRA